MSCIHVKNLAFSYPRGGQVIDIPEFTVARGETLFLFGMSGSGKSTFLGLLAGVLTPSQGEIKLFDAPFTTLSSRKRDAIRGDRIGYIFQSFNLIPYLSVQENILMPLNFSVARRARLQESPEQASLRLAEGLGIASLLPKKATDLSVGQQQRVAAARALIGAPDLLIADEPTSSLDADRRQGFVQLLFQECKKKKITTVFVSHDRGLEPLFDRSVALNEINKCSSTF